MKQWPIAIGLYSVHNELDADMPGTLRKIKEIGYEGVEFYGGFRYDPAEFNATLRELDLKLVGWHVGWDSLQPDTMDATLAYAAKVGLDSMIVPHLEESMAGGGKTGKAAWMDIISSMNGIAGKLAEHGIRFGYHNHFHEFTTVFDGVKLYNLMYGNFDKNMVVELDTGNAICGGDDPVSLLQAYRDRPVLLHCKPYHKTEHFNVILGEEGDENDWPAILAQCASNDVGWLIVECETEKHDPVEAAGASFRNLKKLLG